ncbi:conserved hypothetical protein [Cyanobium sp. PCC 7001]|uniref:DUF6165 family protein n=1 Tax=Cyanobium sp. PCC 7001 TaxID=180281 RepID=UPI00018052D4|nr:DUF6165 family protein [Cyanobium sp. PCC 7001]EDY37202.1 conserved hypothetical protein [Cyanobium sp. PCC 7001]
MLTIPVSVGELVDKLTILALKQQHFEGEALQQVNREQALLQQAFAAAAPRFDPALQEQLQAVNAELWHCEEAIRACDRQSDFGPAFVRLARSIHRLNDRRAALKRAINLQSGSALIEQKSYDTGHAATGRSGRVDPSVPAA